MELTTINSQQNQTLLDIALQEYGSIEGVFDLMDANGYNVLSTDPSPYESIVLEGEVLDSAIYNYYKSNAIIPATGFTDEDKNPDGIDFMTIEDDFIVR